MSIIICNWIQSPMNPYLMYPPNNTSRMLLSLIYAIPSHNQYGTYPKCPTEYSHSYKKTILHIISQKEDNAAFQLGCAQMHFHPNGWKAGYIQLLFDHHQSIDAFQHTLSLSTQDGLNEFRQVLQGILESQEYSSFIRYSIYTPHMAVRVLKESSMDQNTKNAIALQIAKYNPGLAQYILKQIYNKDYKPVTNKYTDSKEYSPSPTNKYHKYGN
eukprot:NODE_1055_length_2404_cov_0.960087.p2 type:complete len:214 gc:universal NODE_1055_length_2404_cov_0.960087:542-1183(+)